MMTDEQRFLFDLHGYLVVPGALDAETVTRMLAVMDEQSVNPPEENTDDYRFGAFLRWSDDFRNLIDQPAIVPILEELLGPRFRLDHAYGMATAPRRGEVQKSQGNSLHHHAGMYQYGCFYAMHGTKMHNGLVVVSYSLTDIAPGAGGFCCIPGSHKSTYTMPEKWYQLEDNPLVQQIPQRAGDVLIFTESLTHGTWPWSDPDAQRRSILMKYTPHYMQWSQSVINYPIDGLTERQKLILQGPYVHQRETVTST